VVRTTVAPYLRISRPDYRLEPLGANGISGLFGDFDAGSFEKTPLLVPPVGTLGPPLGAGVVLGDLGVDAFDALGVVLGPLLGPLLESPLVPIIIPIPLDIWEPFGPFGAVGVLGPFVLGPFVLGPFVL
jgi:hypothetical protein